MRKQLLQWLHEHCRRSKISKCQQIWNDKKRVKYENMCLYEINAKINFLTLIWGVKKSTDPRLTSGSLRLSACLGLRMLDRLLCDLDLSWACAGFAGAELYLCSTTFQSLFHRHKFLRLFALRWMFISYSGRKGRCDRYADSHWVSISDTVILSCLDS